MFNNGFVRYMGRFYNSAAVEIDLNLALGVVLSFVLC